MDSPLLTVPELAQLLRIGRNKAYEVVATGALPVVRIGRLIRVPRAAVDRWIDSGTQPVGKGQPEPSEISRNGRAAGPRTR